MGVLLNPVPKPQEILPPVEVRIDEPLILTAPRHDLIEIAERIRPAARDIRRMQGEEEEDGPPDPRS